MHLHEFIYAVRPMSLTAVKRTGRNVPERALSELEGVRAHVSTASFAPCCKNLQRRLTEVGVASPSF